MPDGFNLSPDQEAAAKAVRQWLRNPAGRPVFRLFGYAGTGKTTIARLLADEVKGGPVYAAFTGKAALQMSRAGCADASTIHSLIYDVKRNGDGSVRFVFNIDGPASKAGVIVVDECSMVNEEIAGDLLRYRVPLLVLGDPAQLPPVKGGGALTEATPDVMLTEIHRQAAENPIIRLATDAREGRSIGVCDLGAARVVAQGTLTPAQVVAADQVICGTHRRRKTYNTRIRQALQRQSQYPEDGDRLICLKNDKGLGIFNGGMFGAVGPCDVAAEAVDLRVRSEDFPDRAALDVSVRREFFDGDPTGLHWSVHKGLQQFEFGYAITTHKAQGSQWDNLIVYDEADTFREAAHRWRYTAITRAAKTLTVVV